MTNARLCLAALLLALGLSPVMAEEYDGDYDPTRTYQPNAPLGRSTWYDVQLAGDARAIAAATEADRRFVGGMRRHHEGAVTMSQDYLADPAPPNPALGQLARAIIANQRYEIALMDEVGRQIALPPRSLNLGLVRLVLRPLGTEGLGQEWGVQRMPLPSRWTASGAPVTERDLRFAKGMTLHHQAALEMARGYLADPNGRNGFLRILNGNILTDQTQEIALMQAISRRFPGDPGQVQVDPAMIHGMPMDSGGTDHQAGHGGHASSPAAAARPAVAPMAHHH